MGKEVITFIKFVISLVITYGLFFVWSKFRPEDPFNIKLGASIIGGLVAFLFLYFGGRND